MSGVCLLGVAMTIAGMAGCLANRPASSAWLAWQNVFLAGVILVGIWAKWKTNHEQGSGG